MAGAPDDGAVGGTDAPGMGAEEAGCGATGCEATGGPDAPGAGGGVGPVACARAGACIATTMETVRHVRKSARWPDRPKSLMGQAGLLQGVWKVMARFIQAIIAILALCDLTGSQNDGCRVPDGGRHADERLD